MAHTAPYVASHASKSALPARVKSVVAVAPATLIVRLRHALAVRRQRRALAGLCERMRADIGLSQADVYREATRAFLDVPPQARKAPFRR
jgi:uncharacterized protein YjiS (DUF1127 family)